jgi:hypothetical protein
MSMNGSLSLERPDESPLPTMPGMDVSIRIAHHPEADAIEFNLLLRPSIFY